MKTHSFLNSAPRHEDKWGRGSRGVAKSTLNIGTRCEWSVSRPLPLYRRRKFSNI